MITVEKGKKHDGCNACSYNSGHNKQNVKRVELDYLAFHLCDVCKEDMLNKLKS